jgi:tetratricopeptide (TPR) repeat protein
VSTFYAYDGFNAIESGNEKLVLHYLKRLRSLSEVFDNDFPEVQYHRVKTALSIKFRMMEEVMKVTDAAISFAKKTDHKMQLLLAYFIRSMAFSIQSELTEARTNLSEAEKLLKNFKIRLCLTQYLIAKSYIEIVELKEKTADKSVGKIVLKTTKDLINNAQKVRKNLPESYRLRAIVFWLLKKPNKALRNFDKSIKAAISYGGNLELSRTYFEAGKFLRDPKNKKERLNSMNSTEYLLKAKSMFEDMNLRWDLEEYEKYMGI